MDNIIQMNNSVMSLAVKKPLTYQHRAGTGFVILTDGDNKTTVQVAVKKLTGRLNYNVTVDGVCKGISRPTAFEAWQWVHDYYNIKEVVLLEEVKEEVITLKEVKDKNK